MSVENRRTNNWISVPWSMATNLFRWLVRHPSKRRLYVCYPPFDVPYEELVKQNPNDWVMEPCEYNYYWKAYVNAEFANAIANKVVAIVVEKEHA